MPTGVSKAQGWMRDLASGLLSSFEASGRIEHGVTVGETREGQILDVLVKLLPSGVAVTKAVLIDQLDRESPKFDAVFLDRTRFPLLYSGAGTEVAMVESAFGCIEVKSDLTTTELEDVFKKSERLRSLQPAEGKDLPLCAAFAYACANRNLAFYDFSIAATSPLSRAPDLLCILNDAVFCFTDTRDGTVTSRLNPRSVPSFLNTSRDSLLVFFNLLCEWCIEGTEPPSIYRGYSKGVFSQQALSRFDEDFLAAAATSSEARDAARRAFLRKGNSEIGNLYSNARQRIGLRAEA